MKNIIHILNTGSFAGAENVVITIIKEMRAKYNCEGIYVSPAGSIGNILKENGILHIPLDKMSINELKRAIHTVKPDIIHAHDFTTSVTAALTMTNVPIISHLHNNPPWLKTINPKTLAYLICSLRMRKVLTVSDAVMNAYIFGELLSRKTIVVSNPISVDLIKNKATNASFCEPTDVMFVGRLTEQKNPIRFINIIGKVHKKIPDIKVCMLGEGELKEACEQRIKELNLSDHINLMGFNDNPFGLLSKSKVLCMASGWEGFGLVAVEALSLGVPVVATPVGGLTHIINPDSGSFYITDDEAAQLIYKLLSDKACWREKSEEALKRASQLDNINEYIRKLFDIYESIS